MIRIPRHLKLAIPLTFTVVAAQVAAQAGGEGVNESLMWPAPIAEDWRNPVQITFQRSWEDAVAVSKETGKPILICVNMDGEPASEHYAGVRYRDPEIAALYEPYVCVVASVYRHTPRDYDDDGQPILCPRLGSVTCGEHIAIEPLLYEKFMDGRRISPRHIMVELGGEEVYDIFFTWDTDSVFDTLRGGIASRPAPAPIARGDRTIFERGGEPRHRGSNRGRRGLRGGRSRPEACPAGSGRGAHRTRLRSACCAWRSSASIRSWVSSHGKPWRNPDPRPRPV